MTLIIKISFFFQIDTIIYRNTILLSSNIVNSNKIKKITEYSLETYYNNIFLFIPSRNNRSDYHLFPTDITSAYFSENINNSTVSRYNTFLSMNIHETVYN